MALLQLTLPVLKASEEPITFSEAVSPATTWFSNVSVVPQGLAFCNRLDLIVRLRGEEQRQEQLHADPNAAAQWMAADRDDDNIRGDVGDEEEEQGESRRNTQTRKKKFFKLTDEDLLVDWYDLLKLEEQDAATEEQIRTAYRRRCLETHPDKQKDHADELFKKVQRAFDILGDADARLAYDSSRPFDDSIPGETVAEADFYKTFAGVFERNKKWSCDHDLPSLGSDTTPFKDVVRFYDRWTMYRSWRDFSHMADLEEIDESMCREEKRYYQRENERQLAFYHKQELKRIRLLVDRTRKNDPRLRRKREQDESKRLQEQEERDAFRRKIRDEEERRRTEEESREKAKKEEQQRKLQESKNLVRQAHKDLGDFFRKNDLLDTTATNKLFSDKVRMPNINWLLQKITPDEAPDILAEVVTASTARVAKAPDSKEEGVHDVECVLLFNQLVEEREKHVGVTRYGEAIKRVLQEKRSPRSPKTPAVPAQPEWTEEDLSRLQKATAKYPPGTVERWSKIVTALRERFTEDQAMAKVTELTAALHGTVPSTASSSASGAAPIGAAAATSASAVEEWSVTQQKQLEQGLRELKDYKEKDKFQKIAKMVDGRTAKECFERFKYLCAVNKKK